MPSNLLLGVNVDHVVTLRQARYRQMLESPNAEPSVLAAALLAEQAGAHSITIHLRADRRHIQDHDVVRLREAFGKLSAAGHLMSGSGSCYFGLCRNLGEARRLAGRLVARRLGSVFVTSVASGVRAA